ncbi:MAG: HutD family protein [Oceanospirillaceae bacterium]|nr:HutD family protein [Oceanospirillaceae bacterium]
MSDFIIIEQSHYQKMPWKNGLGETLEIQRQEDINGLRFRISQASVIEDGVFSDFNGLHRTLVLLSGEGMTLEHKSDASLSISRLEKHLDIARFSGGETTYASLKNGNIEDLNIMVRDKDTRADVTTHSAPCTLSFITNNTVFCGFYGCEETELEVKNHGKVQLKAHSMIIFNQNANATLHQGRGILISITERN